MTRQSKRVVKPKIIFDPSTEAVPKASKPKTARIVTHGASEIEERAEQKTVPAMKKKKAGTSDPEPSNLAAPGDKRKADTKPSWDEEDHPEEKRLAPYRPRCSDDCK